jgi:hypothetical protein
VLWRAAGLQAFSSFMHLVVIRMFVESILRYGLPPAFLAAVVKPLPKMDVKLRAVLAEAFGTGARRVPMQRRCVSRRVGVCSGLYMPCQRQRQAASPRPAGPHR